MKVFVDTNVFVASLTDEPGRGASATALLNEDYDFHTSILNLMEIRSVLSKKKQVEQRRIEATIDDIWDDVAITVPEASDQLDAFEMQRENLLYTMDCVLLALSADLGAEFVTFDRELLDNGAVSPSTLL